jgi:aminoethylphosphonate catabolism LysR family transcriptional regulator
MTELSLPQLKAFDATARLGSMSAAARALGLSQPTVSAHIARLEAHHGLELFFRRGQRIELTDFGRVLHDTTKRIFRAEDDAWALLASARNRYQGRLTVCAVGPYNVTAMIKRFRARWPLVDLVVSLGDSRQIVEQILDYQGDIGVLVHAVDDPRIHCVPFRRQPLVVFARHDHPLAGRTGLRLRDLSGHEFVVRESGSTTRRVFEQRMARAQVPVRFGVEIGSREALREAVAEGLGLGVVAEPAYVADVRLVRLDVADLDAWTHVHAICLADRQTVPLVGGFLAIVDELARELSLPTVLAHPLRTGSSSVKP